MYEVDVVMIKKPGKMITFDDDSFQTIKVKV
jgi:hypothetical protein